MNVNGQEAFNFIAEAMTPDSQEELASFVKIGRVPSSRGYVKGAMYHVTKHAVVRLTKRAAIEGASRNIRFNAVLSWIPFLG
ncbi:uncharacterized protein Z519_11927 [Cladophialophora bantiana CBS 173.52]|uniref:Uncharacterized protein n=1 Tax=Cladophialophora bantiana (strain ATCC 10958 / CBS 173.52 / CDC B-1940 / NIH 8579) TaxID=1442370 RepID=A0A0D2FLM1_CLAB1|nr:uncharacterized protein Z519_11927 [Cladophialophora bantiana CBS 173.52]KIW87602.1 hypothetical protein Z519_11927 [Cladophialophora bantiana CBS 173.52]